MFAISARLILCFLCAFVGQTWCLGVTLHFCFYLILSTGLFVNSSRPPFLSVVCSRFATGASGCSLRRSTSPRARGRSVCTSAAPSASTSTRWTSSTGRPEPRSPSDRPLKTHTVWQRQQQEEVRRSRTPRSKRAPPNRPSSPPPPGPGPPTGLWRTCQKALSPRHPPPHRHHHHQVLIQLPVCAKERVHPTGPPPRQSLPPLPPPLFLPTLRPVKRGSLLPG